MKVLHVSADSIWQKARKYIWYYCFAGACWSLPQENIFMCCCSAACVRRKKNRTLYSIIILYCSSAAEDTPHASGHTKNSRPYVDAVNKEYVARAGRNVVELILTSRGRRQRLTVDFILHRWILIAGSWLAVTRGLCLTRVSSHVDLTTC